MYKVSVQILRQIQYSDRVFALIDVRSQEEYRKGQIFGATRISARLAGHNIPVLIRDKSVLIILYSNQERRSEAVRDELEKLGYKNVSVLEGGLEAWKATGYPTVEGVHVQSKAFGELVLEAYESFPQITPQQLQAEIASAGMKNIRIIEVRPTKEVKKTGSIPGSEHLPGVELYAKLADYLADGRRVILTCAGRTRSILATATAGILEYDNIYELENGTRGWILMGEKLQADIAYGSAPSESSRKLAERKTSKLAKENKINFVSAESVYQSLHDENGNIPFVVLDVRQSSEYMQNGHIPASRNYEGGQIIQNTDDALIIHGAHYVLVSDDETRPVIVAYWLRKMGIINVSVLCGGINAWKNAGYELTREVDDLAEDAEILSEEDFMPDPIEEARHYIEWESNLIHDSAYMEYFTIKKKNNASDLL